MAPIERLAIRLPRNVPLLVLPEHRRSPSFFTDILRLLDETGSAFGVAVHALGAAGGLTHEAVYVARTGSPVRQARHLSAAEVIRELLALGFIERRSLGNGQDCIAVTVQSTLPIKSQARFVAEDVAEKVVLASFADWAGRLGLVSHDKIRTRDINAAMPMVGRFLEPGVKELGVTATSPRDGRKADTDVLCHVGNRTALAIECKGRARHLSVDAATVSDWLTRQVPVFDAYLCDKYQTERRTYELWTTGSFTPDALALLQSQSAKTKKYSIGYKASTELFTYVERTGNARAKQMLRDHFLGTPF